MDKKKYSKKYSTMDTNLHVIHFDEVDCTLSVSDLVIERSRLKVKLADMKELGDINKQLTASISILKQ